MRILFARVLGLFRRRALDRRMEEELTFHLEMEAEANRKRGMSVKEASQAARRAFGGVEQTKEIYRDRGGLPAVELLLKDLSYGCRIIRRSPGFTAVAVLSLALGIGANTSIFTLIDVAMLRALPVRTPDELVSVGDSTRPMQLSEGSPVLSVFSYPLYERLRDQNHVFTGLLATGRAGRIEMSAGRGAAEVVHGRIVSQNYFEVLGLSPALGRTFAATEPGPAVVMSYGFWQDRFAGDPDVLGRTLTLNGSAFTVVGVGPRAFTGEVVGSPADIWIPLSMQPLVNPGHARLDRRDSSWLLCLGRLRPGVPLGRARAEITTLAQRALADYEGGALSADRLRDIRGTTVDVRPGGRGFNPIGKHGSLLFALLAAVGLVLLIACANVANLLVARATRRQKEISMRLALGASRRRLIRQLLTESLVLAAMGGAAGLLLAAWGTRALAHLTSDGAGGMAFDPNPNPTVLTFTVAASLLSAVLFGLAPALHSTRVELTAAMKERAGNPAGGGWPLGKLLVVGQLALSLVLLVGAGLFTRSLAKLETADVGYSRTSLLILKADLGASGYGGPKQLPAANRVLERLRSLPGVLGATVSENGLFSGTDSSSGGLRVPGFVPARKEDSRNNFDQVGPNYFHVVGVPVLAGRDFDERDRAGGPPVAIINDTMARFYFAGRDPLGKDIINGGDRYTVVGVVRDMKQHDLKRKPERRFYVPMLQSTDIFASFNFEIRTAGDAAGMIAAIRREMGSFEGGLKISGLEPVRVLIDQSIAPDRLVARLSGFFSVLALLLAATGLYGVISYAASRRTGEIGLRMALGADRRSVVGMILRETLRLVLAGFAIGLPAALAATRLLGSTLSGVSPADPLTLSASAVVLLAVALLAGLIPAVRASRIDPMAALRQE